MSTIVVFDSGLGSLSIIKAIQQTTKAKIIYFADQKNYPYGKKSSKQLRKIIEHSINSLKQQFSPEIIVVGSNTPSLLFPDLFSSRNIFGVFPPLSYAQKKTKTKSIAILATTATINSKKTSRYIKNNISKSISVTKIDATKLIDLVESAKFIHNKKYSEKIIKETLTRVFAKKNIDVVTMSSTHIPFLLPIMQKLFPKILFLDPAIQLAIQLSNNKLFTKSEKNSLQIFSSGNTKKLEKTLKKLKIKNKVKPLL